MDRHFGKPHEERRFLGNDSPQDDAGADVAPSKESPKGPVIVNEGLLYDDPGTRAPAGGVRSLYDNFGAPPESGSGADKARVHSGRRAGSAGGGKSVLKNSGSVRDADAGEGGLLDNPENRRRSSAYNDERSHSIDPDAPEGPDPGASENGSGDHDPNGRSKRNSGGSKGSCPSWLRTGLYKGGRPLEEADRLLELQEQVIRNSPIGTAVIDNQGLVKMSNEAFERIMGLGAEEGIKDIEQIGARVKGVDVANKFWDAVESGFDVKIDEQVEVEGRGKVTFRASFHPVTFASGTSWCICYFEGASDATPSRGHLWEYQNYIACVATSSGDAIVGLDMDGIVKYWNQGAQALFGYTDDEIVGRPAMDLVPEELRREDQLVLKVVREKGMYKNYDTCRLAKGGRRIPVTMTVSAVRDEDGELMGTTSTIKDLGSAKDLQEKAMEAEKLNAMLHMAVTVYHRINNPLCVIAANSQLLLNRIQAGDGEETKKLESILEATRKISKVLEDLGRLTGIEPQISSFAKKK